MPGMRSPAIVVIIRASTAPGGTRNLRSSFHEPIRLRGRRRTDGLPVFRLPCRRRHVDVPRLPVRQGQRGAQDQPRPGVARSRALGHRAPVQLHRHVRLRRGPDPHQPSLRRSLPRGAVVEGKELRRGRLPREDPRRREEVPDAGRRRARRHGRDHREGFRGHGRQGRSGRERRAQVHADAARRRMRGAGEAEMPERHAVRGRPVLAVQVQALHRRAHGVRARSVHRGVRRRPRQLPVSALVPRHGPAARLRRRQAGQARRPSSRSTSRARGGRTGVRVGPSRRHRPPADAGAAQAAAQYRAAAVAAAVLGDPRPLHPVLGSRARRTSASPPICSTASRTASRCVARCSTRCTKTRCSRARPPNRRRSRRTSRRMPRSRRAPAIRGTTSTRRWPPSAAIFLPYNYIENGAGFQGRLVGLRAHAGARRRRARQAERPALPRIHRQRAAARPAEPRRRRARVPRARGAAPRQQPRAHARVVRPRSSRGAQAACRRNRRRRSPSAS